MGWGLAFRKNDEFEMKFFPISSLFVGFFLLHVYLYFVLLLSNVYQSTFLPFFPKSSFKGHLGIGYFLKNQFIQYINLIFHYNFVKKKIMIRKQRLLKNTPSATISIFLPKEKSN